MYHPPLRDQIRERIRSDLLVGRLRPNEQIRLTPLAERLSVSVTPTREALTQLESEGWVVLHPNRGFFAAPLTLAEAEALYPVLAGLEGLAVELQGRVPAESLLRLRQVNRNMAASAEDPGVVLESDREWHEALTAGCANPFLHGHLQSVRNRAERYEREYMRHSGRIPNSTEGHERIVDAISNAPDQVGRILREHWSMSLDFIREWLTSEGMKDHGS